MFIHVSVVTWLKYSIWSKSPKVPWMLSLLISLIYRYFVDSGAMYSSCLRMSFVTSWPLLSTSSDSNDITSFTCETRDDTTAEFHNKLLFKSIYNNASLLVLLLFMHLFHSFGECCGRPTILLHYQPLCGVVSVHLQILLVQWANVNYVVHGLSLVTITGRWLGKTTFVHICVT